MHLTLNISGILLNVPLPRSKQAASAARAAWDLMSQGGVFPSIPTKGKAVFTLGKLLRFLEKLSVGLAVMVWIKRLCQRLNYAIKSRKQIILVADINFWKETGLAVLSHIKTAQSKHWKKIPSPSTPLGRKLFCLAPLIFHLNSVTSWGSFPFSIFAHSDWYIVTGCFCFSAVKNIPSLPK